MRSFFQGLGRTRARLLLSAADAQTAFQELEQGLLLADCGTAATAAVLAAVRERTGKRFELAEFGTAVREVTNGMLARLERPVPAPGGPPHVVLMLGTNGGGKTTTTAKLAREAASRGGRTVLAAADTFRAAAGEQLATLAGRLPDAVQMVTAKDPGAAAYNAVATAQASGAQLVVIDTAGRQPTSKALMAEACKIHAAASKAMPGAPHETLLAIDANTGQNALRQVTAFGEAVGLTGLVLTKLDSTARGGVVLAIAQNHDLPLRFVGVGEGIDDLLPFDAAGFAAALFAPAAGA